MWQKLSLRARLNTLLAFVMVLGLFINIARLLLEAGPRVAAEDQSVVRLARGFVDLVGVDPGGRGARPGRFTQGRFALATGCALRRPAARGIA